MFAFSVRINLGTAAWNEACSGQRHNQYEFTSPYLPTIMSSPCKHTSASSCPCSAACGKESLRWQEKKRRLFLPWDKARLGKAEAVGFFRGRGRQGLSSLQWSAVMLLERRRAGSTQIQLPLTSSCSLTLPPGLFFHLCLPKSLFCLLKRLLLWLEWAELSPVLGPSSPKIKYATPLSPLGAFQHIGCTG